MGLHSLRPLEGDGGLVNYRILSGAEGKFEIDESTGLIVTVDYLDYETKTSYLMNVSATDGAPPFNQGFCSVYVTLLNELDEAVQFSNASYEAVIMENLALGTRSCQCLFECTACSLFNLPLKGSLTDSISNSTLASLTWFILTH